MAVIGTPVTTTPPPDPGAPSVPHPGGGGSWYVSVAPTARPVTIAEARSQCHLDDAVGSNVTDADLCVFIDAAVEYVESRLAASLMPRTIVETFYDYRRLSLSQGPVISIISVVDGEANPVTDYTKRVVGHTTRVMPKSGIECPVVVTYRAGYALPNGTTPAIPADLKLAILQLTATYFENRESISEKAMIPIPHTVEAFFTRKGRDAGVG